MKKDIEQKQITTDRVVITSFVVDLSDVVINVVVALLTGSVTMISQALEGISDVLSSGFLLWGNKQSKRPPNKKHPYGFGRETYFWALMSGIVTFSITATVSVYLGYLRFVEPEPIANLPLALFALAFSLFSNGYSTIISYKRLVRGKKKGNLAKIFFNSPLIEVKTSLVLDFMGTTASFLGLASILIFTFTADLRFDGIGSMLTGIALGILSLLILSGAKEMIIGRSASVETLEKIKKAVSSFKEVKAIVDLRTIILGSNKILINIEINVKDDLTTDELEKLIDRIEEKIERSIHWKSSIHIELETYNV